jgi:hypothetical protein
VSISDKFQARKAFLETCMMAKLDLRELNYWSSGRCHAAERRNNVERVEMKMEVENMERLSLVGASGHSGQNMPAEQEEGPFILDKGSISLAAPGGNTGWMIRAPVEAVFCRPC